MGGAKRCLRQTSGFIDKMYPRAEGDDYEISERISGGGIAGDVPFDELYMLGLERDNDLLLRAHIGTRDGRKGECPPGSALRPV